LFGRIEIMMKVSSWLACLALICLNSVSTSAQQLTPAWVQLGEGGAAMAKIVVASPDQCPAIIFDGMSHSMLVRIPIPDNFPPLCEKMIPGAARSASVNGQPLVLPKPNPSTVIAFGDTGCRIKGVRAQNCKKNGEWPFEQVAAGAAAENPDLIIHVGDFVYRESPCPAGSEAECGGTTEGDNWETYNTDFFSPAAKLLASAPWVFERGNHEDCTRSWRGWFYYLGPRAWNPVCQQYTAPYTVKLGSFELIVIDTSAAAEDKLDEKQASTYAEQMKGIQSSGAWLVSHYPFWGFKADVLGKPSIPVSPTLQEAWNLASPKGISLVLSGHVHLFELVALGPDRPTQVVAGGGGTELAMPLTASVNGAAVRGSTVVASQSEHQFGFTVLNRHGNAWRLTLKNPRQNELFSCVLSGQGREVPTAHRSNQDDEPYCGDMH
jgi:hypothetical protein